MNKKTLTDNFSNEAICDENNIAEYDSSCQQLDNIFLDDFHKKLTRKHYQELKDSAISDSLIKNNFQSFHGKEAYELFYSEEAYEFLLSEAIAQLDEGKQNGDASQGIATKDVRDYYRKYQHTLAGGWWCSGVDPLDNFSPMLWGCFKPDQPRLNYELKLVKYEHPYKTPTRAFFLVPDWREWELIANRYGVPIGEYTNFWLWVKDHKIPIIITEGAKKAASLLSAGYCAVGLPGIYAGHRRDKAWAGQNKGDKNWSKERFVISDLVPFADGRAFSICFDNDTKPKSKENTQIATSQLGSLLKKHKSDVFVIRWNYPQKGIDDLIVAHGANVLDAVVGEAMPLSELNKSLVHKYYQLSNINETITREKLGDIFKDKDHYRISGVRSPKGTGKTESLVKLVKHYFDLGIKVYLVSHRVQLCQAICNRLNLPYVDDYGNKSGGYGFVIDSFHEYGKCSDILSHNYSFINSDDHLPYIVIIDEVEQVLNHLLYSSTEVKKYRSEIIDNFSSFVKNSNQTILLDADLSNVSLDYLKSIMDISQEEIFLLDNNYKGGGYDCYIYDDQTQVMDHLIEALNEQQKIFITTDSQKLSSKYGSQNLEIFINKKFPDLKILRIDSESVCDPDHLAYGVVSRLNDVIKNYDVIIASPSIGTGVSIDVRDYFDGVYGFFSGVQSENALRQMLMRVRDVGVPRYLYIANCGLTFYGDRSIDHKSLYVNANKAFKHHLNILNSTGFSIDGDEIRFDNFALNCALKIAARNNYEMSEYRNVTLENLKNEGCNIILCNGIKNKDIDTQIIENKEINYSKELEEIANQDISHLKSMAKEDYQKYKQNKKKNKNQRQQERKFFIEDLYKVDATPELIDRDNNGYYPNLQLHYFLTIGRQFVALCDRTKAEKIKEQKKAYIPDFNKSQLQSKIIILELLNISHLLRCDLIAANHSVVLDLAANVQRYSKDIKSFLGIHVMNATPMQVVKKLLKLLGLALQRVGRQATGDRHHIYKIVGFDDGRDQIFDQWQKYYLNKYFSLDENCINTIPNSSKNSLYIDSGKIDEDNDQENLDVNNLNNHCLFWDMTAKQWVEGIVNKVETLINGTFKALVTSTDGLVRAVWQEDHLILAGGEVQLCL